MFCPSCGSELREGNQKYCHCCGTNLLNATEDTQLYTRISQKTPKKIPKSTIEYSTVPEINKKQIKPKGGIGAHSKRCLAFAIVSLACAGVASVLGTSLNFFFNWFFDGNSRILLIPRFIPMTSIYIVGLIFGILSRTNSSKAGLKESKNNVEKVGSILGILGIISNAIGLAGVLIFALSFIDFPSIPYID